MAVATAAVAVDMKPTDIAGRWVAEEGGICPGGDCNLKFDITRCGEGWCGVEVENSGKCGRVAIHLAPVSTEEEHAGAGFTGQYSAAEGSDPYIIRARLQLQGDRVSLIVWGHTGGDFQRWRRTYPLELEMSRGGDAKCKSDAKTS